MTLIEKAWRRCRSTNVSRSIWKRSSMFKRSIPVTGIEGRLATAGGAQQTKQRLHMPRTVYSDRCRRWAMALLDSPRHSSSSTSTCRGVRDSEADGAGPAGASGPRLSSSVRTWCSRVWGLSVLEIKATAPAAMASSRSGDRSKPDSSATFVPGHLRNSAAIPVTPLTPCRCWSSRIRAGSASRSCRASVSEPASRTFTFPSPSLKTKLIPLRKSG
ncbi:hypothetical protein ASALC70_01987 [Alcanivorax sp. ALC70]|nr:hypothetical protein ASALC70_01987 [Alcanivorax sp. ALC70]